MPEFKFIEDTHTYLLDGVKIPSVTSVLPYNYTGDFEYQRDRGSKVHKMIELYSNGVLDEDELDHVLIPYLDSYKQINKDIEGNEVWDYKTGSPHACTDLQLAAYSLLFKEGKTKEGYIIASLDGFRKFNEIRLYHPTWRFAGTLDFACNDSNSVGLKAYAVYLQADGRPPKFEDHSKELRKNIGIFLAHLTAYKWQKEKGII